MSRDMRLYLATGLSSTAMILLLGLGWSRPDLLPDAPWLALASLAWLLEGISWYYALRAYKERRAVKGHDIALARALWIVVAMVIAYVILWVGFSEATLPRS